MLGSRGMCFRDFNTSRLIVDIIAVTKDENDCAVYHGIEVKVSLKHYRTPGHSSLC